MRYSVENTQVEETKHPLEILPKDQAIEFLANSNIKDPVLKECLIALLKRFDNG